MIWIFIAACVLAVGGIAYGVLVDRKKREKLGMGQITRWKKEWVPMTLVIDGDFADEESARIFSSIKAAARFWNREVGITLFAAPGNVGTGAVVPVMRQPITEEGHENAVAYAALTIREGQLHAAVIYMSNWENLPSLTLDRAMKHELGHCLGLAHDEIEFSVMYGEVSKQVYCVSKADKEFLKEIYG